MSRLFLFVSVPLALAMLNGCGKKNEYVAPPPPEVSVQQPIVKTVTVYDFFQGRTEPFNRFEVRPRVTGFIEEIHRKDGGFIGVEEKLFSIEKEEFEAAVKRAQGEFDQASAQYDLTVFNFEKRKQASQTGAVSQLDVQTAEAEMKAAEASKKIAKAALDDADRNLGYTDITAPFSGQVSRALVDEGNLVNGNGQQLLATVVQDDPVYVTIEVNERTILSYLPNRQNADRRELAEEAKEEKLVLKFSDGSYYQVEVEVEGEGEEGKLANVLGRFHALGNEVNPGTGTIEVAATFPNPAQKLAAGLSVRLGSPLKLTDAIIIPRAAIQRDLRGEFVLVAGAENKAERRDVQVSRFTLDPSQLQEGEDAPAETVLDYVIVTGQITAEDRIITSNLQRVREDVEVNPTEAEAGKPR